MGRIPMRPKPIAIMGHEFTDENVYLRNGRWRQCRQCRRDGYFRNRRLSPRGYGPTRTHCPRGHPYTTENTYVNRRNARVCRICAREHTRAHRQRKREEQLNNGLEARSRPA